MKNIVFVDRFTKMRIVINVGFSHPDIDVSIQINVRLKSSMISAVQ